MTNSVAAREIKRRGMCALDEALKHGPVHVVRSNRAAYVVLSPAGFRELARAAARTRLAESEAEYLAGRTTRARSGKDLIREALAGGHTK